MLIGLPVAVLTAPAELALAPVLAGELVLLPELLQAATVMASTHSAAPAAGLENFRMFISHLLSGNYWVSEKQRRLGRRYSSMSSAASGGPSADR
jgi:hypothetical protein